MIKIHFIKRDVITSVDVPEGLTLMEAARDYAHLPEIPGDCGGACACATCHVWIDKKWYSKLASIDSTSAEQDLLEYEQGYDPERSRLGCQIQLKSEYDGLTVYIISV